MSVAVLIQLGILIVSLVVLLKSSDLFIDNAEKIGLGLGISPFIIGVTIVGLGTSLPELATSIISVYYGSSEVVIGNVVGSNITNILLVLGLSAFVGKKLSINKSAIESELPYLFVSAITLYYICFDQQVSPMEVAIFIIMLIIYLINFIGGDQERSSERPTIKPLFIFLLLLSGVGIYFGADYTIQSLIKLSDMFGINTGVLALSLVALGTSLPEVAVSLAAVRKGKGDMAVGNVLGSNLFNTYGVMGVSGIFGSLSIPDDVIQFALPFMIAVTLVLYFLAQSRMINRWGGASLVVLYIFFLVQLF